MDKIVVFTKTSNIGRKLLFLYLIVFPFGQLPKIDLFFGPVRIPLILLDLILGLFVVIFLFGKYHLGRFASGFIFFIFFALLSYLFSLLIFKNSEVLIGAFYLIRIAAYFIFFAVVYEISRDKAFKEVLFKSLIAVTIFVGIFGWIQYLFYPDLRALTVWGWDDHLNRLAGTFLDPGLTSIILVLGLLASLTKINLKNRVGLIVPLFLFITLLFTYSRAGYLALLSGILFLFYKKPIFIFIIVGVLGVSLLLLPRAEGEGVKLERVSSISARVRNYEETVGIIKKSPLIGVGFNNLCLAKKYFLGANDVNSHSCSGSDSSLLLVMATTGILGFIIFVGLLVSMTRSEKNQYGRAFGACGTALVAHSFFVNSMFYPWVMGWILALYAISLKE